MSGIQRGSHDQGGSRQLAVKLPARGGSFSVYLLPNCDFSNSFVELAGVVSPNENPEKVARYRIWINGDDGTNGMGDV